VARCHSRCSVLRDLGGGSGSCLCLREGTGAIAPLILGLLSEYGNAALWASAAASLSALFALAVAAPPISGSRVMTGVLVMTAAASRRFIWSIVIAQVLVQIGAFSLPALLPTYIERWHLTKTEAGALVGIFYAAYVVAVPVLVSLTDRIPNRRVYAVGAALTALSHFGFAFVADDFWTALICRALAGIGWAGVICPG